MYFESPACDKSETGGNCTKDRLENFFGFLKPSFVEVENTFLRRYAVSKEEHSTALCYLFEDPFSWHPKLLFANWKINFDSSVCVYVVPVCLYVVPKPTCRYDMEDASLFLFSNNVGAFTHESPIL